MKIRNTIRRFAQWLLTKTSEYTPQSVTPKPTITHAASLYSKNGLLPLIGNNDADIINDVACQDGRSFALGDLHNVGVDYFEGLLTGDFKVDRFWVDDHADGGTRELNTKERAAIQRLLAICEQHGITEIS